MRKIILILCLIVSLSVTSSSTNEDKKYHFWYSEEVAEVMYKINECDNFCQTDSGNEVLFTESSETYQPPRFKNSTYVGYGKYVGCFKRKN